jgi:hypothetical protein
MIFDGKRLEDIIEDDLQYLVDNQIIETRQLEYKEMLTIGKDSEKKEFLADVSAFANVSGGYLIFGIREEDEVPAEVCGIETTLTIGDTISQLENLMNHGIEPTIFGVQIHAITLRNAKSAIIIKIPQSWSLPHWVSLQGHRKFYIRNSNGKYIADIEELRQLFTLRSITEERIRQFRDKRIELIQSNNPPQRIEIGPLAILHLLPFSMSNSSIFFDVAALYKDKHAYGDFPLLGRLTQGTRHNFDGLLAHSKVNDRGSYSDYTQIFRNGAVETISNVFFGSGTIDIPSMEETIRTKLPIFVEIQRKLGVTPPILVMVSILHVGGYKIETSHRPPRHPEDFGYDSIDATNLIIPESIINNYEFDVNEVLRPIFDIIWNAAGYPRSLSYDENGKWIS